MFMYSSYRIVKRAATATTHTHGARVEADALAHKTRQHIPYAECALNTHTNTIFGMAGLHACRLLTCAMCTSVNASISIYGRGVMVPMCYTTHPNSDEK